MTGKTVEEAVEAACAALQLPRDSVSVEIMEMPQKKLFGSKPAQVKVTALEDEFSVKSLLSGEEKTPEKPAPQQKKEPQKQPAPQPARKPQPAAETAPKPAAESEKEIALDAMPASAKEALAYLQQVAALMGAANLSYAAVETERGIKFIVDGDDASLLIGRRGETMDALQYLCTLVSNRSDGDYSKVSLDVANYRAKREKTLVSLAQREAAKVKKSRYNKTLEPMNPYERRIVHSAIQEIEGVKSESVGSEPNRRVVISLESGGKTRERSDRGGRGRTGGRRDDRRDSRPREDRPAQPAPQPAPKPAPKPKTDIETGGALYGKIEL